MSQDHAYCTPRRCYASSGMLRQTRWEQMAAGELERLDDLMYCLRIGRAERGSWNFTACRLEPESVRSVRHHVVLGGAAPRPSPLARSPSVGLRHSGVALLAMHDPSGGSRGGAGNAVLLVSHTLAVEEFAEPDR
jgi:hypothetical protein